jgi:uncharacterized protein YdaU (DUF1376 family)
VNYFRKYVGDYMRDTAKLSLTEHGALNCLLDHYYASDGRDLARDADEACRLVRALTAEERAAVARVLELYFVKVEGGYRQPRADREIGVAMVLIETARQNGAKGGRPKNQKKTRRDT